ncbi:uncharacterized protein H6S33_011665 [Morchella sextelata]|uniref:uncharacterized protein n=1 Tax=Morchella sextelata TaxID=1174677 RepID=UPI001D03EF93|nr:uncharacterized protein H6S33_011665 [Morchella sextelata]KAH0611238.1 hypothetical protein H6S33_011665 [Morchella sextelata]
MFKLFSRKKVFLATLKSRSADDRDAFGLKEFAKGTNPIIDIVAIHGLNGHRERSWTADNGVNWLKDLLPEKSPNARIFSYGYDSRTHGPVSEQHLHDHGVALVSDLSLVRRSTQTEGRPIIFIAHSLGGIICKSALIHASLANKDHLGGNDVPLAKSLINIASVFIDTNTKLLKHLEMHSEMLEHQTEQYTSISGQFETKFLYETYMTPTPAGKKLIVPKFSAVIPGAINAEEIGINRNHREMVKFRSAEDEAFRKVYLTINLMMSSALPHTIERQRRLQEAEQEETDLSWAAAYA